MKVSELIVLLQKCDPNADVEFAFKNDTTTNGDDVISVAQFVFFGNEPDEPFSVVQLQG